MNNELSWRVDWTNGGEIVATHNHYQCIHCGREVPFGAGVKYLFSVPETGYSRNTADAPLGLFCDEQCRRLFQNAHPLVRAL